MRAAILAIGDELTCGYRLDTNSQAIARWLSAVPLDVVLHMSVGDDPAAIQDGLRTVFQAAEVIVVSGGLGPTQDDLTRQQVAAFFHRPLLQDAGALTRIRERFARRGREMPERNRVQALVPAGSETIQNDWGTAAGFYLPVENRHLFVVPGVPYEMRGMLEHFVLPRLHALIGGDTVVERRVLKLFGPSESDVAERIAAMLDRQRNPLLGLLPNNGTITVELAARGSSRTEADELLAADLAVLRATFGPAVLCEDERILPQVVGDLLRARGLTLAVLERVDGSGGAVAARLATAQQPSAWFHSAQVITAGLAGDRLVEVAARLRRQTGASAALVTGPLRVPPDAPPERPYGVLSAAVDVNGAQAEQQMSYGGERLHVRDFASDAAINLLRLAIL